MFYKYAKGISLVALIITIVIMLILGTVTIGVINGGLFDYARKAKVDTKQASFNAELEEVYTLAKGESKSGIITASDMQAALDIVFGENGAKAIDNEGGITIKIESKYYDMAKDGTFGEGKTIEKISKPGDITKGNTCTGSKTNPFRVECVEDLVHLSRLVNESINSLRKVSGKYIVLTRTLDFNSIYSYADYTKKYSFDSGKNAYIVDTTSGTSIKTILTDQTGKGFIPIGNPTATKVYSFGGIFDGQGYSILNLYTNGSGLFSIADGATIKNVTVGGRVKSSGNAAGILGNGFSNTISNCCNKATVTGSGTVGGIVGNSWNGTTIIENCWNEGNVKGNGISGSITGTVKGCYNVANLSSGSNGIGKATTIANCYNTGTIGNSKSSTVRGIGTATYIVNCYNSGTLLASGTNKYGISNSGKIANCYYLNGCGKDGEAASSVSEAELLELATTLDKSYTIDTENTTITVSDSETQNVWTSNATLNNGYPIFFWQIQN